jgi:hypothetical protein
MSSRRKLDYQVCFYIDLTYFDHKSMFFGFGKIKKN